jgi:hypothetical protein
VGNEKKVLTQREMIEGNEVRQKDVVRDAENNKTLKVFCVEDFGSCL